MTNPLQGQNPENGAGIFVRDKIALTISLTLLGVAGVSWIASYYLMPLMMSSSSSDMILTSTGVAAIVATSTSLSISVITFFEVVWVVGMAAMMFPAMIPIVLFYNKVSTKLAPNPRLARLVGTPLFLSGYLITYGILGLGAYLSLYFALAISTILSSSMLSFLAIAAPVGILFATGMYQFTPLKFKCLTGCVTPIAFFATRSRKGLFGSLRMGFDHGVYCVGCCVLYMLVMLIVGAMSIPVMAILAGVIALEKVVAKGSEWFGRVVGFGFLVGGIIAIMFPNILILV